MYTFSGVFHPNGLELVADDNVWDMRTLRLLRTVPELHRSIVKFSPQNVIYAVECETRRLAPGDTNYNFDFGFMSDVFKTLDGDDYSRINTVNVRGSIMDLSVNKYGSQIALIHKMDSVQLYNVGARKNRGDGTDSDTGATRRCKECLHYISGDGDNEDVNIGTDLTKGIDEPNQNGNNAEAENSVRGKYIIAAAPSNFTRRCRECNLFYANDYEEDESDDADIGNGWSKGVDFSNK
ncbi:Protein mahjong [Pseudolycoriella hygida]|uniref:Protein mahjong n=1 Tax=Pseudolycoriella hygida TaxID=35572 RepID=A0A9Q0S5M5_9DIPT|nr:Protein mahjong [Pseudolycoriella hygida]